jgi:hypothetical protein
MIASHNNNFTVTIPVLVELKETQENAPNPDAVFYTFIGAPDTGRLVPGLIVPSNAAAAVVGLDGPALLKLERKFGKLPKSNLAEVLAASRLIDAVRLRDPAKLEQHLAYLRAGAGEDFEILIRRHFVNRGGWPGVLGWALPHLNVICALGRLCVWMSNRGPKPMVNQGEQLRLGIYAADFTTALLLQLMLQMEESASIAYCERCGKAYIRAKYDQRFCGFRCGSRERQARYRKAKRRNRRGKQR